MWGKSKIKTTVLQFLMRPPQQCTIQLQKYLTLCNLFGLKRPMLDLAVKSPLSPSPAPSPLGKVAGNTLPCSLTLCLEEQL